MATTPTSNSIPSEAPQDLKFNAGKIDEFVTSMGWTYTDRLGVKRYTIEGINYLAQQAMNSFGYVTLTGVTFTTGATVANPNEVLFNPADNSYYKWTGTFASGGKVVPANSTPASSGGVGAGKWLNVGDSSLRSQLAATGGVDLVNGAAKQTDVDALTLKTNKYTTPESFSSLVVSGDWTAAINAAFATGLPVMGSGTYNVSGIINTLGQSILGTFTINTSRYSLGSITAKTIRPDSESLRMLYLESAYDLSELLFIKNLGFNTINHYGYFANNGSIDAGGTFTKLLNNAQTAGLQVNIGTENPEATANLATFINSVKNHPAVMGFSVYDEPATRGITVAQQDAKIATLRGLTTKSLSFVDLIIGSPFKKIFSTNYDIAFVDSYSLKYATGTSAQWLTNDLKKMRFDYGGIKAQTGISRVIPIVSAFTDSGSFYASDESQVIAASNIFGTIDRGNFGAFVWDGMGDPNITGRVRTSANLQAMVKGLSSARTRKQLTTEVYIFGGTPTDGYWPINPLINTIPQKDNSTDAYIAVNAYPVRVRTGASETDRTTTATSYDYSGIGYKGSIGTFLSNIKMRSHVRFFMEYFNTTGTTSGVFSVFSTDDSGYTVKLEYADSLSGNKTLDFDVASSTPSNTLALRIENTGDISVRPRKFVRGLIVSADW